MCLVTTKPTYRHEPGVLDPPPHRSRFSAHPPPGVVRLPRGSTHSYRRSSTTSFSDSAPRVVEYRRERPREIEWVEEPRRSRSRSVLRDGGARGSRGSFVEDRRRSVSRVRYA
ncbi:hypothetical protein BU26DRAFT_525910 [Trematosphaeria pertusa]|uniref:Uncharacterized protein n=1 Tax=Trematosphaeria pertusa TaxID=390896 RepID=A0A6A6HRQ9_9PLEO|nr:uncharacterized protein BU26DRAFT_525910 [Trematosphaeria pertusa]KAF2240691.1 hypothetical protein BU26DRAFT_525910 [Trematosphaeria pertusa]